MRTISNYVLDPFHLQGQQVFESINQSAVYNSQDHQKEHLLIWNSETTQNLTFIFITTKQKQLFSW